MSSEIDNILTKGERSPVTIFLSLRPLNIYYVSLIDIIIYHDAHTKRKRKSLTNFWGLQ